MGPGTGVQRGYAVNTPPPPLLRVPWLLPPALRVLIDPLPLRPQGLQCGDTTTGDGGWGTPDPTHSGRLAPVHREVTDPALPPCPGDQGKKWGLQEKVLLQLEGTWQPAWR